MRCHLALTALMFGMACPGQDPQPAAPQPAAPQPAAPQPAAGGGWANQVALVGGTGGPYALRDPKSDRPGVERAALDAGTLWLTRAQADDGSWSAGIDERDARVAVTSLCALALMGQGTTLRSGAHRELLKRGIVWLRAQQDASGAFADATGPHMLATLAFVEAYTVSSYRLLKGNTERGLAHLAGRRHVDGGWRAGPDAAESDPSLTSWGATVLGLARFGELVETFDEPALEAWLDGPRANLAASSTVLGYPVPAAQRPALAFDQPLANAWTRCWLESGPAGPAVMAAHARGWSWRVIDGRRPSLMAWLRAADATAQAADPVRLSALCGALAKAQIADGEHAGSWEPIGVLGEVGGRAATTAVALMVLEAPIRYAPQVHR